MRSTVLPQNRWERGEEAVHGLRLDRGVEPAVELVVQRAGAVHGRDVLGNAREVDRALARIPERRGELRREVRRPVEPKHRYETPREDRLHDLRVCVRLVFVRARGETRLVSENRGLELPELVAGLDAELVERDPCVGCTPSMHRPDALSGRARA